MGKENESFNETCVNCKDHDNRIFRSEGDIQSIFTILNGLLWKIAIITGLIMGIGQGTTIAVLLTKINP